MGVLGVGRSMLISFFALERCKRVFGGKGQEKFRSENERSRTFDLFVAIVWKCTCNVCRQLKGLRSFTVSASNERD